VVYKSSFKNMMAKLKEPDETIEEFLKGEFNPKNRRVVRTD